MKRLFILLLATLMFAACLPTPEQEYVINKSDDVVEQKINATPKPADTSVEVQSNEDASDVPSEPTDAPTEKQVFPDRWDEDATQLNERVAISVHADVIQKEDGLYPVYRLKDAPLTDDDARELAAKILEKPVEAYTSEMTKGDYQRELQRYLDEVAEWQAWVDAGKPDWGDRDETGYTPEGIEETTSRYMEQIKNAPDTLETKAVSDYSGLHFNSATVYTLESGAKAYVYFYQWGFGVYKNCAYFGQLYREMDYRMDKEYGESNAKFWHEVTMERADAEAILDNELVRLGLSEYSVSSAEKACLLERFMDESMRYKSSGWSFRLTRNPAGYPVSDFPWEPSQYLNYGSDDGFVANKPVREEHLTVFIDENGVQSLTFSDRKAVSGLPNANVELLPFDQVRQIAKNTLSMCMRYDLFGERTVNIEIYSAMLTTYTLRVKDSDEYYEMPCWVLFFDWLFDGDNETLRMHERESAWMQHDALVLNAVDGSIVHTDYGY